MVGRGEGSQRLSNKGIGLKSFISGFSSSLNFGQSKVRYNTVSNIVKKFVDKPHDSGSNHLSLLMTLPLWEVKLEPPIEDFILPTKRRECVVHELFVQSSILSLDAPLLADTLNDWVNSPKDQKWRLLFKGSRDGFHGSTFHALVDNKGSTYTLVKSNRNIFGGYNPHSWTSVRGYTSGFDSFLFSLVNLYDTPPIKIPNTDPQFGACNHPDFLPTFGRPGNLDLYDLKLSEECNTCKNSHCCFESYTNNDKGSRLFTGRQFFKVDEIEVFVRV